MTDKYGPGKSAMDFHSLEEYERYLAAWYDFTDWLSSQRRKAENHVRALYPKLNNGVSVQQIEMEVSSALFWKELPDELTERYALDYAERPELYDGVAKFIDKYQFFLDMQPEAGWDED